MEFEGERSCVEIEPQPDRALGPPCALRPVFCSGGRAQVFRPPAGQSIKGLSEQKRSPLVIRPLLRGAERGPLLFRASSRWRSPARAGQRSVSGPRGSPPPATALVVGAAWRWARRARQLPGAPRALREDTWLRACVSVSFRVKPESCFPVNRISQSGERFTAVRCSSVGLRREWSRRARPWPALHGDRPLSGRSDQ